MTNSLEALALKVKASKITADSMNTTYYVFCQINADSYLTDINSDVYITDPSLWIYLDSGCGEMYRFAKDKYLAHGLRDEAGNLNYKLVKGAAVYLPRSDYPTDHEILMTLMGVDEDE